MQALQYLQSDISSLVDQSDDTEASAFRALLSVLLTRPPTPTGEEAHMGDTPDVGGRDDQIHNLRTALFESLLVFVNPDAKQPKADLVDLLRMHD